MFSSVFELNKEECFNLININPSKKPRINLPDELIEYIFHFLKGDRERIGLLSVAPFQFRHVCFTKRFSWDWPLEEIARALIKQTLKWNLEEIFNPHSRNELGYCFWDQFPIKLNHNQIKLILSGNIKSCSQELISQISELRNLRLNYGEIEQLPNLKYFKNLIRLDVPSIHLKVIPASIKFLQNLEYFNVSDNQLTSITPYIGKLKALKELNLRNNELKTLPDEICNLKQLKILDVGKNRLENLPKDIGFCDLKKLYFAGYFNHLHVLPDSMRRLIHLNCEFDESTSFILNKIQNPRAKIEYLFTPRGYRKTGFMPISEYILCSLVVALAVKALFFRFNLFE